MCGDSFSGQQNIINLLTFFFVLAVIHCANQAAVNHDCNVTDWRSKSW